MANKEEEGEHIPNMQEVFQEVLEILQSSAETPPPEDVDYDEALRELETSLEDLRTRADEVYKATGLSREQLEEYSKNPDNFSKEEWDMLEQVRGELKGIQSEADEAMSGTAGETQKKARRKGQRGKWMKT